MNFFLNFNDIVSQKLFLFQNFMENLRFKFLALNRMPLTLETCPEIKNIRINSNFKMYNFSEISTMYSNFLKEKFSNNLNNKNWNQKEKNIFIWIIVHMIEMNSRAMSTLIKEDWLLISNLIVRSEKECILKWNSFLKSDPQVSKWSEQDDAILMQIMNSNQEKKIKWNDVAIALYKNSKTGIFRSGRKCRERWINCLSPALLKTKWTPQEDYQLLTNILKYGKRWSLLTKMVKGRNEHSIKYHFFSLLKKHGITLAESDSSEEVCSSKTMSEIFKILEKMNHTTDDKTTNLNTSSICEEENSITSNQQNQCSLKENNNPNTNSTGITQQEVSKCRLLNYWHRVEEERMIFQEDLLLNSKFQKYEAENTRNKKRKEFNDIDSFDTSDEEMKELLAFHKNLKKPKHL